MEIPSRQTWVPDKELSSVWVMRVGFSIRDMGSNVTFALLLVLEKVNVFLPEFSYMKNGDNTHHIRHCEGQMKEIHG